MVLNMQATEWGGAKMAILPVSGIIEKPNLLGTVQNSLAQGYQIGQARAEAQRRNRLADISGQAYGATGDTRNQLVSQAVGVDPQAGMALDKSLMARDDAQMGREDAQARRLRGAAKYMMQAIESNNPAQIAGAHRTVAEFMGKFGQPFPEQYTPDMLPKIQEVLARTAYLDEASAESAPTAVRQFEMMAKAAGLTPGTPAYEQAANIALGLEGRASNAGIGFEIIEGPDGRKRYSRRNPRTGQVEIYDESIGDFVPLGGQSAQGQPLPASGQVATPIGREQLTPAAPGEDIPQTRAEFAAFQAAVADAESPNPTGQPFRVGDVPYQGFRSQAAAPRTGALGVGRSPEEEAAATAEAKARVEMQTAADIERAKVVGRGAGEADVSRQTRIKDSTESLTLLDEAEGLLSNATGSLAGSIYDRGAAALGVSTQGAQATDALKTVAAQLLMKVPRFEGPQSNMDVQAYREAAGNLADDTKPVETRLAALRQLRALNEKYLERTQQAAPRPQQPAGQPMRVNSAADYEALPSGAEYIAPDGSRRRKR